MFLKKRHGPVPGDFSLGFIVAGGGVVVETVLRARIEMPFELDVLSLEYGLRQHQALRFDCLDASRDPPCRGQARNAWSPPARVLYE